MKKEERDFLKMNESFFNRDYPRTISIKKQHFFENHSLLNCT